MGTSTQFQLSERHKKATLTCQGHEGFSISHSSAIVLLGLEQ